MGPIATRRHISPGDVGNVELNLPEDSNGVEGKLVSLLNLVSHYSQGDKSQNCTMVP